MKFRRTLCKVALAAGLTTMFVAPAVSQQQVTLKFHTFMGPQSNVWLDMHLPWMEKIERESGGRIRFERYPAMQLGGSPRDLFDHARDGVADVVWTLPGYTPGRFPRIEVFELPFMMTDAEATSRAYWEYLQTLAKDEFKGVHLLAVNVHGPGVIHTRTRQIRSVEDMKGLKVRGPTRFVTRMLGALGATPVGMPLPQIPDAISKGVIEGAVIPWEVVPAVKINELARYHAEFDPAGGALYTATFVLAMNRNKYESLPPELKKVIDDNSGIETSAWLGKVQQGNDPKGRKTAETPRNTIYTLSPEAARAFRTAAAEVADDWIREMDAKGFQGRELYEGARALIRKYSR